LERSDEDDLAHREIPKPLEPGEIAGLVAVTLARAADDQAGVRKPGALERLVRVVTNRGRETRLEDEIAPVRDDEIRAGIGRAKRFEPIEVLAEVRDERDGLRKRTEVAAAREHGRRDQRRKRALDGAE